MERYRLAIRDLPVDERPRERLTKYGAEALSTAELLAILLRTGTQKESAIALAERLLATFESLKGIARASVEQLCKVPGVGPAKAVEIRAMVELGKRLAAFTDEMKPMIRGPQDVVTLVGPELRHEMQEQLKVLFLDTKCQVMKIQTIFIGSLNESISHPREIYKAAMACSADSIIIAHNHPTGDPTPSEEDRTNTLRLKEAGEIVGIQLLDHVIIADSRFVSMRERNLF